MCLLPHIEIYQSLLRKISDSINTYLAGFGNLHSIKPAEMKWLLTKFYPSLENTLPKLINPGAAKDIREKIDVAHTVLSNLSDAAGYGKYKNGNGTLALLDRNKLRDADTAVKKILEAQKRSESSTLQLAICYA